MQQDPELTLQDCSWTSEQGMELKMDTIHDLEVALNASLMAQWKSSLGEYSSTTNTPWEPI